MLIYKYHFGSQGDLLVDIQGKLQFPTMPMPKLITSLQPQILSCAAQFVVINEHGKTLCKSQFTFGTKATQLVFECKTESETSAESTLFLTILLSRSFPASPGHSLGRSQTISDEPWLTFQFQKRKETEIGAVFTWFPVS